LANVHNATPSNGQVLKYIAANNRWEPAEDATGAGGAALTDGDKGDITVSSTGAVFTIDNDAVTSAKIADDAITSALIADNAVVQATIADDAVGADQIAANAVGASELADDAVDTAAIADDAVTDAKLANSINSAIAANTAKTSNATHTGDVTGATSLTIADDAVTSAKIADGTIVNANINASAAIAGTKISPDFGSQNIVTTGSITGNDLEIDSGTLSVDASNNRVGIGTTSPNDNLEIQRSANSAGGILIKNTNDAQASGIAQLSLQGGDNSFANISLEAGGQNHHIKNDNQGNLIILDGSSERMRIDSSGRVGIGTTSPSSYDGDNDNLVVQGSGNTGITIATTNTASSTALIFSDGTGDSDSKFRGAVQYLHNDDNMRFFTGSTERIRIDSGGKLMMGKTDTNDNGASGHLFRPDSATPNMTTTINTSTAAASTYHLFNTNATNNGYRFYVQANGGVGNHSGNNLNLSDEREKKNITLMGSVYNTFKQFVFKDFNYISENDSATKKHGLIAQDVESIDSDLVSEDFKASVDSEGNDVLRKGLKEEQFMMIGFKALQEAIAKIEVLETKVAALEAA